MNIKQLEKTYNLDFDAIAEILKKQHITINLEHLNDIPEQWVTIIKNSLGPVENTKEDLSTRIKKQSKSGQKKTHKPSRVNTKNCFYAYVKFIGEDKKHAFIKRLDDINQIDKVNLRTKDENDYKLQEDCTALEWEQIILCEETSAKYKLAKIRATYFEGTILFKNQGFKFIDWLSFKMPFVINHSKAVDFDEDDNLVVTRLKYSHRTIICEKQNIAANEARLIPKIEKNALQLISKDQFSDDDFSMLQAYKKTTDNNSYNQFLLNRFKHELDNKVFSNENVLEAFIAKWQGVDETIITYANLKQENWFAHLFNMWLGGLVHLNFWEEHLIDACIQFELEAKTHLNIDDDRLSFEPLLNPLQKTRLSKEISLYFEQELIINSEPIYEVLRQLVSISAHTEKKQFYLKLNESLNEELQFEFWVAEKSELFPKSQALKNFSEHDAATQDRIIQELEDEELLTVIADTKELSDSNNLNRLLSIVKNEIILALNPLSFDIESDTESIYELAWNNQEHWHYLQTETQVKEEFQFFNEAVNNSENIVLGHNIIEFDCPLLEKIGVDFNPLKLWDTLLVEVLLNPNRKSYALATKHNAKDDAYLTLDFFINQVLRILKIPEEELDTLWAYLPKPTVAVLGDLKSKVHFDFVSDDELLNRCNLFFRPEPKLKGVVKDLNERIEQSEAKTKLIIGTNDLKIDVQQFKGIRFSVENDTDLDFSILDEQKVKDSIGLNKWLKSVLTTYVKDCKKKNVIAYWGNLPPVVKIKLQENTFDVYTLFTLQPLDWSVDNLIFLSVDELYRYSDDLLKLNSVALLIVQPDLISVTQKQLLKNFDLDFFKSVNNDNYLWMKFSGGQSYVPISRKQCENFDIEPPAHLTNFWVEKYLFGKYRVWGSYNWEALLETLNYISKDILKLDSKEFKKDQTNFARVNITKSNSKGIVRFNPESVYRSRYWVFQKELVQQTITPGKLTILLIQRQDELEVLETYFRSLGYFVPNNASSLGRKLELLYAYRKSKKILIATINNFSKIVDANYLGELNVVIDSFNLIENLYISKETSFFKSLVAESDTANSRELDGFQGTEIIDNSAMVKDTFLLLKLHLPQISQYRNLLFHANPNHKLWILDPRVNDFPDLSKLWNARSMTMNIWQEKDTYEDDVKLADIHIRSVKPITDLPFGPEEIKQILSQVFLGKGANWYDYQEPYLDLIIPGKTDLLVTLPTGGGKSLLFQAPALFKSAFTNRLTIVVTPLKALMEDQVDALWQKGFYGSVEYLNSDRSTDTQVIYRALAGGEIALLFVTPERFRSQSFKNALNVRLQSDGGLEYIVFDEAHCVSQWGHEFRPDYFNCAKEVYQIKKTSPIEIPLLLFSATVSEKIYKDFNHIFS